jgi:hypothetical protein
MRSSRRARPGTGIATTVVLLGPLAGCGTGPNVEATDAKLPHTSVQASAESTTATATPAPDAAIPPLSAASLKRVREHCYVEVVDPAAERARISARRAIGRYSRPAELSLTRATCGAAAPRLTWLFIIRDARLPIMGPPRDRTGEPHFYIAEIEVHIDATTGKFIRAGK